MMNGEIHEYFVSGMGICIPCKKNEVMGWVEWIIHHGGIPVCEKAS